MLVHLLQTLAASPTLAEGVAPSGLLHPTEQAQLDALRVVKRRRDWLLGRWTAKHLVQQYLFDTTAARHPLPTILILPAPDGAPYATLADRAPADTQHATRNTLQSPIPNLQSPIPSLPLSLSISHSADRAPADTQHATRNTLQSPLPTPQSPIPSLPLSLSISHSADRAFCALTDEPGTTVGADIERIEPREPGFVEQFFTPAEIAAVRSAPSDQRDALTTAIWSAKEAVLKALRVGLRADTRYLNCTMGAASTSESGWAPFDATLGESLLADRLHPRLTGWWQAQDGFILTLACCETLVHLQH